jgi:hypothetical protein
VSTPVPVQTRDLLIYRVLGRHRVALADLVQSVRSRTLFVTNPPAASCWPSVRSLRWCAPTAAPGPRRSLSATISMISSPFVTCPTPA